MALRNSGTLLANVDITDTFDTQRIRINQMIADGVSATGNTIINGVPNPDAIQLNANTVHDSFTGNNEGLLFYDQVHKTLNMFTDVDNLPIELGQNEYLRIFNNSGASIPKGAPITLTGLHNTTPTAQLADATSEALYNTSGLASKEIPDNTYGFVTISGIVAGTPEFPFDTTHLSAGARCFVSANGAGELVTTPPFYPNYPMCIGYVVNSDTSNGEIVVEMQNHAVPSFVVRNNAYIEDDLTVGGNFNVIGTQVTSSSTQLAVGNTFIYVGRGDDIANSQFTGSGLNDLTFKNYYEGTGLKTYYVRIDSAGTPDTFMWSTDNFATQEANSINITGGIQALANGISVQFQSTTGHTVNDTWDGTVIHSENDIGLSGHWNDGTGYTHTGVFRDASDDTWKFFNRYDPEVAGVVDTGDASFRYANIRGAKITGFDISANTITATNKFTVGSDVKAYYGGSEKLRTKQGGIAVTGNTSISVDLSVTNDITVGNDITVSGGITVTGDVSAANYVSTSDAKFKGNVRPITGALELVKQLEGVRFNWKESGDEAVGFIAQQVEPVIPEVINTDDNGTKSINYSVIVSVLVEAIKELSDRIDNN